MSGEARSPAAGRRSRGVAAVPGLVLCIGLALAAEQLARLIGQPSLLIGLCLGLLAHPLYAAAKEGVDMAAKSLLEVAIALLGLRLSLETLTALGPAAVVAVVGAVALTMGVTLVFSRAIGADRRTALLAGGATAICGSSACLAIAATLPRERGVEQSAAVVVVAVTVLSTAAMLAYPALLAVLGIGGAEAGFVLGGSIHNVPQAVGAGYAMSPQAGDAATATKLLRVAMILPVTLAVALLRPWLAGGAAGAVGAASRARLPWFIPAYLVAAAAALAGAVPQAGVVAATELSLLLLTASVVAIGAKTTIGGLAALGWRPVALVLLATACLGGLMLAAVAAGVV